MNKQKAQAIVDRQAEYKKANPGPFSGLAPDVNGAQLRIAREVLEGTIPEDAPPVTGHPLTAAPQSVEEHVETLAQIAESQK